jgi:hypothetical protein
MKIFLNSFFFLLTAILFKITYSDESKYKLISEKKSKSQNLSKIKYSIKEINIIIKIK